MRVKGNEVDTQPESSSTNEQDLGACGRCEGYNCFGPHLTHGEMVQVKCTFAKRFVVVRIDITSHLDCHHFENKHSRE